MTVCLHRDSGAEVYSPCDPQTTEPYTGTLNTVVTGTVEHTVCKTAALFFLTSLHRDCNCGSAQAEMDSL